MSARYIYRLDDITPTMNWAQFWKYIELFRRYRVKPLLGVVPDNRDPNLEVDREYSSFWQILRELLADDVIELAQHGYQHVYQTSEYGILGKHLGFAPQSEFAGLSYDDQFAKIRRGQAILREQGLDTDVWMAPSHSFDQITLRALREAGFHAVTDGIAIYPFRKNELIFVPQQLWAPKVLPLGVWTICLHPNTGEAPLYEQVREHVASDATIISFGQSREVVASTPGRMANFGFKAAYTLHIWRYRRRQRALRL